MTHESQSSLDIWQDYAHGLDSQDRIFAENILIGPLSANVSVDEMKNSIVVIEEILSERRECSEGRKYFRYDQNDIPTQSNQG